jgi:glycosyltransferase involved in cell wall biosynthesis
MDTLYLVVPCYNEEEVLPETSRRLKEKLEGMVLEGLVDEKSRILFVDDGSRDKTWEIISRLHQEDPRFLGLKLSRNKGHQNALLAGLMTAKELCDMAISLDADLQDDVDAIDRFVLEYQNGCDIVYGVRSKRETDTWFKRTTAEGFYKVMQALGVDIVDNHADYRLMSRRALEGKIVEWVSGVRLSRDGGIISAQEIEIQLLHSRERFIVRRLFFNRLLRGRRFFHRYILRLKARAGKEVRRRHKNTAFSKFKAGRKTPASPRRTGRAAAGRRLSAMALFYSIPHAHASPAGKKAAFLREV